MHGLLGVGRQEVADAGLEVTDGLLAVPLGPHVMVNVPETVGPAFQLNLVPYAHKLHNIFQENSHFFFCKKLSNRQK
jgi:hypothetical protein